MMKKITQNLTNLKAWQSTIFAFMFLFSLTINSQEVGQEYLGNPTINTTETSPETGSIVTSGNFSGETNAGSWGFGQQGSYAPTSGNNGDCYSEDRQFKMFKKNGEGGLQYITQTITALPAGNYDWSYWNRWAANGGTFPSWSAEGDQTPKFVILTDDDGDGTWTSVQDNVSTEPTDAAWYQESGTWTNDQARDVQIKLTKMGGADSSALTNLAFLWFLDNASFAYASAAQATEPTEAAPTPPAREAGDVVSIFSDAYTDVTLTELPTSWSDVTTFEATTVASDNVWKLSGLEFLGMVTNYDTGIDVSTMEMLHIDYWVPTGVENELLIKIVNTIDGGEDIESLGTTVSGSWQSIDIDMTGFVGNLANTEKITQILIDAVERADTVFIDNFYFYKAATVAIEVGDEFLTNPSINTATGANTTTPDTGVDGNGNFSGETNAGWGFGQQGAYAGTSAANGDCHSEDKMFKMFKKNGEGGLQYITQTITALPAGNYDWSYWNRWAANGGTFPSWSAEGDQTPKFVILTDDDGDGTWTSVQDNVSTEPTDAAWYQESGTWTNDQARDVKIKFTKTGGADSSALTNLAFLWFLDNASFAYAGGATAGVLDFDIFSFSIYPNPTSGFISIKGIENINSIKVYSILGALEKEVLNTNQIDVSELSSGIHFIKVDNGTVFTRKIIKQ